MFMSATIQTIVAGTPIHADSSWMPTNGNVNRSTQIPNATGIDAASTWPPSFCHQTSPRTSSIAPTVSATAAPSSSPRVSSPKREEGERRHEDAEEERDPAEARHRRDVQPPPLGPVDRAEDARNPADGRRQRKHDHEREHDRRRSPRGCREAPPTSRYELTSCRTAGRLRRRARARCSPSRSARGRPTRRRSGRPDGRGGSARCPPARR